MSDSTPGHIFPILTEEQLQQHLRDKGLCGISLDIDETLSWTVGEWMAEMLELFGNPEGLTPKEAADKYHLCQYVPYWAGRPEVESWMAAQRLNNEMQTRLPLVEGALPNVLKLHSKIPVVAYITTRPQAVLQGTQAWLRDRGFPDAAILGKPDDVAFEDANRWKGVVLPRLLPHVRGHVDDNPGVMRAMPGDYGGRVFWFMGTRAKVDELGKGGWLIPCPEWGDVAVAVEEWLLSEEAGK